MHNSAGPGARAASTGKFAGGTLQMGQNLGSLSPVRLAGRALETC